MYNTQSGTRMPQPVIIPSSFALDTFSFEFSPDNKIVLHNCAVPAEGPLEYDLMSQGPVRLHTDGHSIFLTPVNGATGEVKIDLGNPGAEIAFFKRTGMHDIELIGADDLSYELVMPDPPGPPLREVHRFNLSVCPVELHAVTAGQQQCIIMKYTGNGTGTPGYTRLTHIRR